MNFWPDTLLQLSNPPKAISVRRDSDEICGGRSVVWVLFFFCAGSTNAGGSCATRFDLGVVFRGDGIVDDDVEVLNTSTAVAM